MDAPSSLYDIPLPLSQALDEVERQKNEKRSVYQGLSAEIERSLSVASKMAEKSREMEKKGFQTMTVIGGFDAYRGRNLVISR